MELLQFDTLTRLQAQAHAQGEDAPTLPREVLVQRLHSATNDLVAADATAAGIRAHTHTGHRAHTHTEGTPERRSPYAAPAHALVLIFPLWTESRLFLLKTHE